jgi:minimal PKS ketosynthase (KS/KS alpha)
MDERCAVITGIGVSAPGGMGVPAFWAMLTAGRSATRTISLFDPSGFRCRIAAECDYDPGQTALSPQQIRRMDRTQQLAALAALEAMADSGLDWAGLPPERTGVSIGNAVGNTITMEREYVVVSDGGRQWLTDQDYAIPYLYNSMVPSSIGTEIAWICGAEGPVAVISTGCTSGLDGVGYGAQLVVEGTADIVLAGASDAPISPITVECFDALHATSTRNDDPEHACRPFDRDRDGLVLGEGSAMFVLEEKSRALARGAHIYAAVAGYANRANAYHMTGLKPDGRELAEAIRAALASARVDGADIDYVNAHGSGTRQNDRHETAAVKDSLGMWAYQIPMSSIKSMIGHSLGGIGAIEVAASALAIKHDVVPPTANLEQPDPECDLDYVPVTARDMPVDTVLSIGSGFGGFQTAVVLTGPEWPR